MAKLIYCGPVVKPGEGIPLPEGWPMATHSEDDPEVVKAKLASGNYRLEEEPEVRESSSRTRRHEPDGDTSDKP